MRPCLDSLALAGIVALGVLGLVLAVVLLLTGHPAEGGWSLASTAMGALAGYLQRRNPGASTGTPSPAEPPADPQNGV